MLEVEKNQDLVRALYGLLMILPQSDAFLMLKQRLDCVPNYYNKIADSAKINTTSSINEERIKHECNIDFKQLLQDFIQVQEKHKFFKKNRKI